MNTMPDQKTVCVLIPTLQRAHFLEETLAYLVDTEYPHDQLEIFVVDGGSTDATGEVVARFDTETDIAFRWHSEKGLRNSPARNYVLRHSTADAIVFVDDDCITRPNWIPLLIEPLLAGRADIAAGTDTGPEDDSFLARCEDVAFSSLIGSGGVRSSSRYAPLRFCPMTCNMAMFREQALAIGGFDETIRVAEDTDFAYKARVQGLKVEFVPEATVWHRRRDSLKAICFHNYIRGYGRFFLHRRYPEISERAFLLPALGLVLGGALFLAGFVFGWAWLALIVGGALYLLLLLIVAAQGYVHTRRVGALAVVPVLVALHHFCYALGTLHAPLTHYRKVYVSYEVNVSDPFGRQRRIRMDSTRLSRSRR